MKKNQKLLEKPIPNFVNRLHFKLSDKKGWIAAVESESGDYILGKSLREAVSKARETFPDKVFYFIRIGYSFVQSQTGGLRVINKND